MNTQNSVLLILSGAVCLAPASALAGDFDTNSPNHFSFGARFGFNISARFKNPGTVFLPANPATTPNGAAYNYDDGYVFNDVSGSVDGQTWYWGYNNSGSQVAGNTILLSRSTASAGASSPNGLNNGDANFGGELTYNRELGNRGKLHYGFEAAANYLNVALRDNSTYAANADRTTDAYAYAPGTTPPQTPPAYQGSFDGPGFVIGNTPVSSTTSTLAGGATISGKRQFDANIWGFRLGPYVEFPVCRNLDLSFSGGLAFGLVNGSASWTETVSVTGAGSATGSGSGHDLGVLWGGYVSAKVAWQLSQRWSVEGGAQFQALGSYEHNYGGRVVELDLSRSLFVTVGAGYRF